MIYAVVFLVLSLPATAQGGALAHLDRIAVRVEAGPDARALSVELERRIVDALRSASPPAIQVDASSADVLRLIVGIRAVDATVLRGFYLPFSGTYAIGPIRLALQRPVSLGGVPGVPATVWEDERQAAAPWRRMADETRRLVDELITGFLQAHRAVSADRSRRP